MNKWQVLWKYLRALKQDLLIVAISSFL